MVDRWIQIGMIVFLVAVYVLARRSHKRRQFRAAFIYYVILAVVCLAMLMSRCKT